jgi:hypothetical protein
MLRGVALVKTEVSEEDVASIIRLTRIDELGTTLAVTSNLNPLQHTTRHMAQYSRRRHSS